MFSLVEHACVKRKASSIIDSESKRARASTKRLEENQISDYDGSSSKSDNSDSEFDTRASASTPASSTRKVPSELKTIRCPFDGCCKSFNRPARLTSHVRSHNNERLFACQEQGCQKTFLRADHLRHHVKSAHTSIRDYACGWENCGKKFVTATRLRRHEEAHEGRNKYRCTDYSPCSQTFRKHDTLKKHITIVHLQQKPFVCKETDPTTQLSCQQTFISMSRLRSHERRLHAGLRYWCTECQPAAIAPANNEDTNNRQGVGFATYSEFQAHTIAVHPPLCSQCSRTFESRHALKAHVTAAHSEVPLSARKLVVCDHPGCGRGFTKKANLKVHKRTIHDGERAAICGGTDLTGLDFENWGAENACGRAFKNKGTLEEHVRTQHLGLGSKYHIRKTGPREKEEGGAKKEQKALKAISALTGEGYAQERAIECTEPGCAFRFIRNYDLSIHLASKHGKNDDEVQDTMMERNALSGGKFWNSWVSEEEDEDEQTNDEVGRQMIENLDHGYVDKEHAAFWTSDERIIDQSPYENHVNLDLTETITSEVEPDATDLIDPLLRGGNIEIQQMY